MTLKEYKEHIDALVKAGYGKAIVIASSDDEGNSFQEVFYPPGAIAIKDFADNYMGDLDKTKKYVCLN